MKTIKVVDSMGKNAKWSSKYLHVSFLISKSNSQYSFYFSFSIYFFFSYTIPIFCFPVLFTKLQVIISYVYYHTSGWGFSEWLILLSPYALPNSQYSFFLFVFVFSKMSVAVSHQNAHSPPQVFPSSTHEEPPPVWPRAFHISLAGILDAERKREWIWETRCCQGTHGKGLICA